MVFHPIHKTLVGRRGAMHQSTNGLTNEDLTFPKKHP
jgi:hypothetical protein